MRTGHLLLSAAVMAIASPAIAAEARFAVDMPAQALDAALFQISRTTGVQMIFTDPAIMTQRTDRIAGTLTTTQMLTAVLAQSEFTYRFTSPTSVRVIARKAAEAPSSAVMPVAYGMATADDQAPAAPTAAAGPVVTAAADGAEEAEITVVGTQIRGSKATAALPVTVVDAAQITATGALSGDELFRAIPQMGDVSFNSSYLPNSSNAARGDVGSVNLRNLGVGNTLVLLNGRRVVNHPTSRADDNLVPVLTYNTNTVPVFGLERLEVLRDGAAAIYGSDAVAGVVNTILRSDFVGVQAEVQFGQAEGTDMQEINGNLLLGKKLGDRGNVTLFASYDSRTAMNASDKAYTASADKRPLFAGTAFDGATSLDGRSTITPWGSFQTANNSVVRQGTVNLTNASGQFHIQPATNTGCQTNATTGLGGGLCIDDGLNTAAADRNLRFDAPLAYDTSVIPKVKRLNLFLNGHYALTEGLELFGEAGYYLADTSSTQSSTGTLASGPLVIPASNYFNPFGPVTFSNGTANPNRLPGINAPAAGVPVTLRSYNFADAGANLVEVRNSQFRLLAGLRFEVGGFNVETAALYSESAVRDRSDGISQTLLQQQLALSTPDAYNPFNGGSIALPSGIDTTPSSAASLAAIRIKTTRESRASLALADIKASRRDLFALPGGNVGVAIGAEIRRETINDNRDARVDGTIQFTDSFNGVVNPSDLVGSSPSPDTSGSRTVAAAYLEFAVPLVSPDMNVPLIHNLELQIAGRYEHYSDVGSVAKPKIAGAWDIIPGIRLRASYAESFKAPNLEQVNATVVTRSNTRTDYVRCEADLRAGRITNFTNCGQAFAISAQRSGNPALKPETSTNISAGIVLEPRFLDDAAGRVTLTADYWQIKQKGVVGIFGEGNALINDYLLRTQGSSDPNVIRADATADDVMNFQGTGLAPAGRVLFVRDQYVNLLPQDVSGIDLGFNWRSPDTGVGRFTLNVNAAHLRKFFLQPSPPIQALIDARAAGTINAGTVIADAGDRRRQNGKPVWRVTGSLTWTYDRFQIGGFTQYTSDLDDTGLVDATGIPFVIDDQLTGNLYAQVSLGKGAEGRYRVRVGVRNLTNAAPPLSSNGFLGSVYNPYQRYWYVNLRSSF